MFPFKTDRIAGAVLSLAATTVAALSVLIVVFLIGDAASALQSVGWRMAIDESWRPAKDAADGQFGMTPMAWGTLAVTLGAGLLAGPAGVASAVFCRFYAPRIIAGSYRRLLELLAGKRSETRVQ